MLHHRIALMLLLAVGLSALSSGSADAETRLAQGQTDGGAPVTDPALGQAIRGVISDQLTALRRDDAAAAFNDASPFIQGRFQQPDIFLQMVRSGYAPVYRPQQVEFRDLVPMGDGLEQRVFVIGPDGRAYLAHYQMQRQPDGSWKINGCILEPLTDQST